MRQKELSVKARTFLLLFWKREAENSNIPTRVGCYAGLGVTVENKGRRNPRFLLLHQDGALVSILFLTTLVKYCHKNLLSSETAHSRA